MVVPIEISLPFLFSSFNCITIIFTLTTIIDINTSLEFSHSFPPCILSLLTARPDLFSIDTSLFILFISLILGPRTCIYLSIIACLFRSPTILLACSACWHYDFLFLLSSCAPLLIITFNYSLMNVVLS
jgi:hypothetical protein